MSPTLRAERVQPGPPWLPVEVLESVDSTNAEAARDPRPWRVVVAEEQTAGRGRLGRPWTTMRGTAIAVSVVLPHTERVPLGWIPLVAGLALRNALASTARLPTWLKWPNDLLVPGDGRRKIAGILCEWTPEGVVVGTGVNVTTSRSALPVPTSTSVVVAGGDAVGRERLLAVYLMDLAGLVHALAIRPEEIQGAYRRGCVTIGKDVVVEGLGTRTLGLAVGVDGEGRLVVDTGTRTVAVAAGDVTHVR